ncbi:hydrogenase maturation protease [Caenispirillum bisanense]|uniref:Hydrogenase maturation protease n=1 Tax=Caenispirillum bisanense TaxID=414052 RepID=A0A286GPK5_9PROT|nr:hydrogenase maturation protease [Caenispirillum bisanense]SOD96904.1 hydrogenase maturation protease [Caenispirillum bisanense]
MSPDPRPLVIGIGQPWRGDDAAGLAVLDLLPADRLELRPHHGEGLGLIALWEGRPLVVVVDAACAAGTPGRLHRIDTARATPFDARLFRCSSHAFGVNEAIATGRALGRMPARLIVHAVEGERWDLGAPLSPAVAAALPALAEAVLADALPAR